MTGITATGEKKLLLFSGRAHPELTSEIAGCLGIEPTPTRLYDFANGEIFVRFLESVRAATPSWCRATPHPSTSGSWSS